MTITEQVIDQIDKGREGLNKGLPLGLPKLEKVTGGVMPSTYTLIAAGTSVGKTSLALYSYIYKPIMDNIDNEDFHIIYYSLEMKSSVLFTKLLSIYLWEKYGVEISYKELMSQGREETLPDNIYEMVKESIPWMKRLEEIITVYDKGLTADRLYADLIKELNKFGEFIETETKKIYVPNKKNQIILVVLDHLALIRATNGRSKKEEMDIASAYLVTLRNKCGISPVVLMQTNRNASQVERRKNNWSEPELSDIKETSNISEDADVVMAIYDPYREKVNNYRGYKINILQHTFRGIIILKNRYGDNGLSIGTSFFGRSGIFKELPRADEINDYEPYKHLSTNPEELENIKEDIEIIKEKKDSKPTTFKFVMT